MNNGEQLIEKIQTVLDSDLTAYRIAKEVGYAAANPVHDLRSGKVALKGIKLSTAIAFEKLYDKIKEENEMEFEGKTYTLTGDAEITEVELDGRFTNYHEAQNGGTYDFEMAAPALDEEGNEVTVYWMFENVKGEEKQLDEFDYDKVDRVE